MDFNNFLKIALPGYGAFSSILDPNIDLIPGVSANPVRKVVGQPTIQRPNKRTDKNAPPDGSSAANDAAQGYSAEDMAAASAYGGYDAEAAAAAAAEAERQAEVNTLRGEITGRGGEYDALINELFTQLDTLLKERSQKVESEYSDQFKKATDTYESAIPRIRSSYAAVGAGDSTDVTMGNKGAEDGYNETNKTINKNKQDDLTKIGQYGTEQRAKLNVDRDNAKRNVERAGQTDDVDALRGMRNDLESGIGNARVTKATLTTDGQAGKDLSALTADGGRFQQAQNALDGVIKSSMSGGTKAAAVKAIVENGGLSDEEKQKINLQYGNVYNEQNLA